MGLRIKISGCQSLPSRGRLPPVDLTPSRCSSPLPRGKLRYELLVSVKSPPPLMTLSEKFFFSLSLPFQTKITKFRIGINAIIRLIRFVRGEEISPVRLQYLIQ